MTTRSDIKEWLSRSEKYTHMLVVVDTFDYDDYPVFTNDVRESIKYYNNASMQRIMEVYNLRKDFEAQLDEHRAWNI
jgi:hypothetical protein